MALLWPENKQWNAERTSHKQGLCPSHTAFWCLTLGVTKSRPKVSSLILMVGLSTSAQVSIKLETLILILLPSIRQQNGEWLMWLQKRRMVVVSAMRCMCEMVSRFVMITNSSILYSIVQCLNSKHAVKFMHFSLRVAGRGASYHFVESECNEIKQLHTVKN